LRELLLVTFTRAATGELRERVRERLVSTEQELARQLAGATPGGDDQVVALLSGGPREMIELRRGRPAPAMSHFGAVTIPAPQAPIGRDDIRRLADAPTRRSRWA